MQVLKCTQKLETIFGGTLHFLTCIFFYCFYFLLHCSINFYSTEITLLYPVNGAFRCLFPDV